MPDKPKRPDENDRETIARVLVLETEGRYWAIRPQLLGGLSEIHGRHISEESFEVLDEMMAAQGQSAPVTNAGVAVVPLKGVLMPQVSLMAMLFGGGSSLLGFRQQMRQAVADPEVSAIVMDVDSPGGMVDMIPEVAQDVRAARDVKPVVAVANTMAGSAAYWLASQADQVVVTPSGEVGSVGVYQIHKDISEGLAQDGVKPTIVSAGKYKVEGNPYEPLSAEAAAAIQADVNDYYDMFTQAVADGRGVTQEEVQNGYGEGRSLLAKRAVKAGLADRVDTLENTVKRLGTVQARTALRNKKADDPSNEGPESSTTEADVVYSAEDRYRLLDTLAGRR